MNDELLLTCSQNIDWLSESDIKAIIYDLQVQYADEPINIISSGPIGYVSKLEALSNFYGDDILKLAAVICRSIIQGHPLQDGNKRFGMALVTNFLELNNIKLTVDDEEFIKAALKLAKDEVDLEALYQWICNNVRVDTRHN